MSKFLILLLVSFLNINCLEEDKIDLVLSYSQMEVKTVGKKGTALVIFKQIEPIKKFINIKKETCFNSSISNGNDKYDVKCGLWNQFDSSSEIYVFCNIEEKIPSGNYSILLNKVEPFDYGNYHVTLKVENNQNLIEFEKVDRNIIDLYSGEQTLTIENTIDSYELKFNIVSYNQEILIFNDYMTLDCHAENDILRCPLTKKDLLAYLSKIEDECDILYVDPTTFDSGRLRLIPLIKVKVKDIQKKDVFVGLNKLLVNANEKDVSIAYETNVTNISNYYRYYSGFFKLTFMNKNKDVEKEVNDNLCNFLKYDNNPLLLVCKVNNEGTNWLKEIKEETKIEGKNILYNYRIPSVKNNETIHLNGTGSEITWYHPKVLDFTKTNGPIFVIYHIYEPDNLKGFTYNEDEEDLKCQNFERNKKCEITKEHFKGKKNGLYFLKQTNHLGNKSTNYEIPPIKVIVEESPAPSKGNIIPSPLFYSLLLLILIMV